jgi:hypothetical protein
MVCIGGDEFINILRLGGLRVKWPAIIKETGKLRSEPINCKNKVTYLAFSLLAVAAERRIWR